VEFLVQGGKCFDQDLADDCQAAGVNFTQRVVWSVPIRWLDDEIYDVAAGDAAADK
jgi:hypothetical protein